MHRSITNWKHPLKHFGLDSRRCARPQCSRSSVAIANLLRRSECYLLNRKDWFCSAECLDAELAHRFESGRTSATRNATLTRMPLGLLLFGRGIFDHKQLRDAIALQEVTRQRIGECLCSIGATTEEDVLAGLCAQWACPLFPVHSIERGCASLLPAAVLRKQEMLPVHFTAASRDLYVAFARGIDYATLYAIEQMLDCHTEPCVVPDRVIYEAIERRSLDCDNERAFHYPDSSRETAHIVVSYARQCGAENVFYATVGQDLWVRVVGRRGFMDITFQRDRAVESR